jgi:tetratricopeptide (TPR) repeat protein
MIRYALWVFAGLLAIDVRIASAQSNAVPLVQRRWFETRSAHFNVYSCAAPQNVYALAAHLEQFSEAYTALAGAQAVASPPIVVMAFPDQESMKPFLPVYQGKPANLAGFFKRDSGENLIVLALPDTNSAFSRMEVIFHEYSHLLFRRNGQIWPLWLSEGMADIYSTFEVRGRTVRIGQPVVPYTNLLAQQPLIPLKELFAVDHESPQYNERNRQGIFYAESWLLTHFLMAGDNPDYRARFGQFTRLLREGQLPEQAFTNALQSSLADVEAGLRRYLKNGRFVAVECALSADVSAPKAMTTRGLTPVEILFRLGKELLCIDRFDAAESQFTQARKLAPASPFSYEGLGLLAAERDRHDEAVRNLKEALQRGAFSFQAHYFYAREKYALTADPQGRYSPLDKEGAAEIRGELQKTIALMPDYGPAYQLSGFLEMMQGDDFAAAERYLQRAIQLEPENPSYLLSLAQAQMRNKEPDAARQTLKPLLLPHADAKLRAHAKELIQEIGQEQSSR